MPAASEIQPHRDSGAYATVGHRLHVPLIVPTCVQFQQYVVDPQDEPSTSPDPGWRELPFKEGEAFEVNNRVRSHCRFRKRGTVSLSEFCIKMTSGRTKRQCDSTLPPPQP
jgi:hypothetical protein